MVGAFAESRIGVIGGLGRVCRALGYRAEQSSLVIPGLDWSDRIDPVYTADEFGGVWTGGKAIRAFSDSRGDRTSGRTAAYHGKEAQRPRTGFRPTSIRPPFWSASSGARSLYPRCPCIFAAFAWHRDRSQAPILGRGA